MDVESSFASTGLLDASEFTSLPVVSVFILYEDLGTALRAKRSFDLLPASYRPDPGVSPRLWKLDLLSDRALLQQAIIESAGADVIILSLHGRRGLHPQAREWLARWAACKEDRPYAVGVLVDSDLAGDSEADSILDAVRETVECAGADFFSGFCETPGEDAEPAWSQIHDRAERSSTVLDGLLQRVPPPRHWGLNE